MSPYQVESYLKAARFIADRLILDKRPTQNAWEFGIKDFRGSGRGDFQTDTAHVLTTHYPWRSNLYFIEGEREQIWASPYRPIGIGRYREGETVTLRLSARESDESYDDWGHGYVSIPVACGTRTTYDTNVQIKEDKGAGGSSTTVSIARYRFRVEVAFSRVSF